MNITTRSVTNKELREFGLIFGAMLAILFGLILPWIFDIEFPIWPWCVLAVTGSLAIILPLGLKPLFKVWMLFGKIMSWINMRLILGIVFYLLFMPFGLIMKLLSKDLLSLKLDSTLSTYRVNNKLEEKNNMENPF
jgi:hypothetical protein